MGRRKKILTEEEKKLKEQQELEKKSGVKKRGRKPKNKDFLLERNELYAFLGLLLLMDVVNKPTLKDYWSTDEAIHTPFFQCSMSRLRFLTIFSNLSVVSDPLEDDKIGRVRPFFEEAAKGCRESIDSPARQWNLCR